MRSLLLSLAAAAVFALPAEPAKAEHYYRLDQEARAYESAAELFHRKLARSRRASDFTERVSERLVRAARDLTTFTLRGEDPRRIALAFDEVGFLHTRLEELLVGCERPDPILVQYWQVLDETFQDLLCAVDGCQPVCTIVTYQSSHVIARPVVPAPIITRPIVTPPIIVPPVHRCGPANPFPLGVRSTNPFDYDHDDRHGRHGVRDRDFDRGLSRDRVNDYRRDAFSGGSAFSGRNRGNSPLAQLEQLRRNVQLQADQLQRQLNGGDRQRRR